MEVQKSDGVQGGTQDGTAHQSQARADMLALELRAIRVSYLLLGALKSLAVILNCAKFTDLLLAPKVETNGGQGGSDQTNSKLQSVLQFLIRSMVKWAVRPCPIKQHVTMADLERAQIMIFKGALSRMHDDEDGKNNKGEHRPNGHVWFVPGHPINPIKNLGKVRDP